MSFNTSSSVFDHKKWQIWHYWHYYNQYYNYYNYYRCQPSLPYRNESTNSAPDMKTALETVHFMNQSQCWNQKLVDSQKKSANIGKPKNKEYIKRKPSDRNQTTGYLRDSDPNLWQTSRSDFTTQLEPMFGIDFCPDYEKQTKNLNKMINGLEESNDCKKLPELPLIEDLILNYWTDSERRQLFGSDLIQTQKLTNEESSCDENKNFFQSIESSKRFLSSKPNEWLTISETLEEIFEK